VTEADASRAGSELEPAFAMPAEVADGSQLWLVRHGETEWSRDGRHTGRTDIPLTPYGEREAAALRAQLTAVRPALVLSSPRQRARRTAELAGLSVDAIDPDLAEWDYGDYEGLTSHEIVARIPGWTLFTHGVPDGETAAEVGARADRVLTRAAAALDDGPVMLFAHGHICRVLAARWLGRPVSAGANYLLGAACPSALGAQYGVPVIEHWNLPNPATSEEDAP
jgi:broad specificity phosphatase PhoE